MIQNECQANKAASQASTLELRRLTALASAPLARKRRQVEVENAREILQTGDTTYVSPAEVADEVSASVDAPEVQHGSLSSSATRRRVAALVPEIPQPSPSSSLQAELSKGESKAVQEGEAQRRRNQQGTETSEGADGKQISPEAFAQEPETSKDATPELQPSSDRSGDSSPRVDTFVQQDESSSPSHGRHLGAVEGSCVDGARKLPSEIEERPSNVALTAFPTLAEDIASSFIGISTSLSLPGNAKFELPPPPSTFEMPSAVFELPNFRLQAPALEIPEMPSITAIFALGNGGNGSDPQPDVNLPSQLPTVSQGHSSLRQEVANSTNPVPANVADIDVGLASGTLKGLV